ncbi:MAG: acyltransferase [Terracidiphilus sp.]|jgi:peptidoglycan/LPS O-acetylase OafA/YrhL
MSVLSPAQQIPGQHKHMRIKELDGLRGIAVLAVILHHYFSWLPITGSPFGWLGVNLFFVLSGFLITSILLQLRDKQHYFSVFYSRRALRIFPPYYIGIAVYLCVSLALGRPGDLETWLSYIFYYSSLLFTAPPIFKVLPETVAFGLGVTWSLSVEEVYYTIWAPIVRFTSQRIFAAILVGMIVAAPVLRFWWQMSHNHPIANFYCQMDGLALGSAVALFIRCRSLAPDRWLQRDKLFDRFAAIFIPLTVAFWALSAKHSLVPLIFNLGVLPANLSFALIVHTMVRHAGGTQLWVRPFRAKWLRSVGKVSYSLYLFHYALLIVSEGIFARLHLPRRVGAVGTDLLALTMSFAVAYGLWYGMESRILRWKDRKVPSPVHP